MRVFVVEEAMNPTRAVHHNLGWQPFNLGLVAFRCEWRQQAIKCFVNKYLSTDFLMRQNSNPQ